MASFSFGTGNAAKLLRIPVYALGRALTLLIPRSRDQWVFGCGSGIGDGALAVWARARADERPAVWLTGSERDAADASAHGIPHLPRHSLRGFWRTARARVVVITHGFGDVNRYATSGAFIVQLWHGIPLKRIGLDSPETVRSAILPRSAVVRRLLTAMYASATRRIDLLPAASHLVRGRLESAFALDDERVIVTGEPRVDVLSRGTAAVRRAGARQLITDAVGPPPTQASRFVLYAPTWRDGQPDPAIPSQAEWHRLIDVLTRRDAVLLVRSHPLGAGEYRPPLPTDRVRSFGAEVVLDVTPALAGMDALITDYSSLAFDSALVPLPVLYLAPDVDDYGRRRGFYGRYADVAGQDWCVSWGQAIDGLEVLLADEAAMARGLARARELSARMHAFRDGRNTERVYRAIVERAALPAPTRAAAPVEGDTGGTTA